jgi:hypothetical protein
LRDFVPVELLRDRRIVVVAGTPAEEPAIPDPERVSHAAVRADQAAAGLTLFGEADG